MFYTSKHKPYWEGFKMTEMQLFAFVILPVIVGALGYGLSKMPIKDN